MEHQDLERRMVALEARVRLLEDERAVQRQISRWGPAVDTGDSHGAAAVFAEDGSIQNEAFRIDERSSIVEMVESEGMQSLIRQGCAHINSFPLVTLDGDQASALSYSRQYLYTGDDWKLTRCSANHWQLSRGESGWRITSRDNHIIDGGPEARTILADALDA